MEGKFRNGEPSRIWGTVAMSVQACELTDAATLFDLDAEISVFLHSRCGNDPPLAQILFAPSLAHGVCVPVLGPRQRMMNGARPPMTKITGVAGLEGFWWSDARSRFIRLACSALGIQQTVHPFHRYSLYYLPVPAVSLLPHPLPLLLFLPDPSSECGIPSLLEPLTVCFPETDRSSNIL